MKQACLLQIVYVAPMKALAAEMVRNFGRRLEPLGIAVRELTGDMQLTKAEILKTQVRQKHNQLIRSFNRLACSADAGNDA